MQRLTYRELKAMKAGVWDIESVALNASFGWILACGFMPLFGARKDVKVLSISDTPADQYELWDDSWLVDEIIKEANQYDVLVSHNGMYFDIPMVNTRALTELGKWLRLDIKHIDTRLFSKKRLRMSSNHLDTLLGQLRTRTQKTRILPAVWRKAACGDEDSLGYIVKHNVNDCVSLAEATRKLAKTTWLPYFYAR